MTHRRILLFLTCCILCSPFHLTPARADDLQNALTTIIPELDKGCHDKMKLAFYVLDLRSGSSNAELNAFVTDMRETQKRLAGQLESLAKAHHIDTSFHYGNDILDKVRKRMEDTSGDQLQDATGDNFKLHVLSDMEQDYTYQISLIKTLRSVSGLDDPLKAYLDDSLKTHQQGLKQIQVLLQRFKM